MRFLSAMLLSFVAFGLAGGGCASGDVDIATGVGAGFSRDASAELVGSCNPRFCESNTMGFGCCLGPNGPCGINLGKGCVGKGRDGG